MDARELKGLELAARARIERHRSYWSVPSSAGLGGGGYKIDLNATTCTCEDFELHRPAPCKHLHAVRFVMEREKGVSPPVETPAPELPPEPKPRKASGKQNWPLYNAAQTKEKRIFLELLADLCSTVPNPPPRHTGRPRTPRADAIFAAAFKVYSTVSGRRFTTDMRDAQERGYVAHAPHYNSTFRVFEDPDTTNVLNRLIIRSSLPLRSVETHFAVDSSGFSTSRFLRWYDEKYGVPRKKAEWVKCHLMCGVKTNIVTSVVISDSGDCPMLPSLVATTAQNFTVGAVSADKAYLSESNLEFVDELGGVPFIPFKINSRGDTRPGIWERMFAEFTLNREAFLTHYHKRSNVESTFSMIKGKFGDAVRSKTDVAMRNEVLAKVLCHNLVCLVHEMHELGIDPRLAESEARVIRLPGA